MYKLKYNEQWYFGLTDTIAELLREIADWSDSAPGAVLDASIEFAYFGENEYGFQATVTVENLIDSKSDRSDEDDFWDRSRQYVEEIETNLMSLEEALEVESEAAFLRGADAAVDAMNPAPKTELDNLVERVAARQCSMVGSGRRICNRALDHKALHFDGESFWV